MIEVEDFFKELQYSYRYDYEDRESFSKEEVIEILSLFKKKMLEIQEQDDNDRKSHYCTMGDSECNARGYCNGDC